MGNVLRVQDRGHLLSKEDKYSGVGEDKYSGVGSYLLQDVSL